MGDINELLTKLKGTPEEARPAVEQLAGEGASVVPAVIEAMRTSEPFEGANLRKVLLKIEDRAIVPLMLEHLSDENLLVRVTAFRALGALKDKRALKPLLDQLRERGNFVSAREWAADALGELGDRRAVATLLKAGREILDGGNLEDEAHVLIAIVAALAKLGDQELAPAAISLSVRGDEAARTGAVGILKYLAGPGLFRALETNLRGNNVERRWDAAEAMAYLGVKEAIAALVKSAGDDNLEVQALVVNRLRDLTGEEFDDDLTARQASAWWRKHQASFKGGVVYRLGKPLRVADLVEQLKGEPHWRDQIIDELLLITGEDFGVAGKHFPREEKEFYPLVSRWWARQPKGRFKPGRLYKYGYEQDTRVVFEDGA